METIVIEIASKERAEMVKKVLKALDVKIVSVNKMSSETKKVAESIRKGFNEMKAIEEGKIKPQNFEDVLNEL